MHRNRPRTHTITVRMPTQFHDALVRHAAEAGTPVATYVREAVLIRCVVEHVAASDEPVSVRNTIEWLAGLLEVDMDPL